ncbi:MAG: ABC transporter substrate-binding protein [Erysipelotrichaceae bacterium]|nr:ABC transporter substrate-binding protein [Erysipelotrichaceae bacterium]
MKKLLSILLALLMVFALVGCSSGNSGEPAGNEPEVAEEGKVLNIWTWNTEFWGFLGDYYADEVIDEYTLKKGDVTIVRTTYPSDGGAYQDALDAALLNQANAADDEKVDLFLAEADYIIKYTNSDATMDVKSIGVTDFSNTYKYTVEAASDANGVVKGVSFQCCPAAVIYRRSIAKDVLGTDDPAEVQAAMSDWDKFNDVAALAKEKGYYMIPTTNATYRVYSNNTTSPWVVDGKLNIDSNIVAWMDQSAEYVEKGYTAYTSNIWGEEATSEMFASGKSMCFFGPAWYFNFSMGNAQDPDKGCFGDWAICQGPQAWFWGGTWILAATGTDNPTMVADIMNTFINNEEVCSKLVSVNAQFSNNQAVNAKFAADASYGNDFLGGQNDTAVFAELAKNIKFQNITQYDQLCNEGLQTQFEQFLTGAVDRDTAIANFKDYIKTTYPSVTVE